MNSVNSCFPQLSVPTVTLPDFPRDIAFHCPVIPMSCLSKAPNRPNIPCLWGFVIWMTYIFRALGIECPCFQSSSLPSLYVPNDPYFQGSIFLELNLPKLLVVSMTLYSQSPMFCPWFGSILPDLCFQVFMVYRVELFVTKVPCSWWAMFSTSPICLQCSKSVCFRHTKPQSCSIM